MFRKRQQVPNGVTCAKQISANYLITNLITDSASPRSGVLKQSVWNHLVIAGEVICLPDTGGPLGEGDLATEDVLSASHFCVMPPSACQQLSFCTVSVSCHLLPVNSFHSVQCLRTPRIGLTHESLNKANWIFKIYSVELCFLTASKWFATQKLPSESYFALMIHFQ